MGWSVVFAVRHSKLAALTCLAAAYAGCVAEAQTPPNPTDYPQWRGSQRDGSASAFVEPDRWPDFLTRRWTVDVGEGYATPVIVGPTVYTFTRQGGDEVATALDANTGTVLWQTRYSAPYEMFSATRDHGEGPKATPLFHNDMLYTHGISGAVSAFDAVTGDLVWQVPPPDYQPDYGAAVSAVAAGDLVILHPGYGPLTAFDAGTGEVRWTAGTGGFFASPIIVTLAGTRQVISVTQENVIGVSIADGTVLWQYSWPGSSGGPTPVLHGDTVMVSGSGEGATAFRPVLRDGAWTVETLWKTDEVSMYVSTPVVVGDTLFGLSTRASGQFFALDAVTGNVLWLGEPREAENTAVVKAGDVLFLLNDDAELIVARASRGAFEPLKRYTVADSATWAQPAISGNRLFIKDLDTLALWMVD